jgi:hypothetical protein
LQNSDKGIYQAELYSLSGMLLMKKELDLRNGISEAMLSTENGMYILKLFTSEGISAGVWKVIINK